MISATGLRCVSDRELLAQVQALVQTGNEAAAKLVAQLGELEARRLYLSAACSSLFDFCTRRLGLSEPAAYTRIASARAARRFPTVLQLLASGRLHLSGLCALAPHLTKSNHEQLLGFACGRSLKSVKALVAERCPRDDVPDRIRKLPVCSRVVGAPQTAPAPAARAAQSALGSPASPEREARVDPAGVATGASMPAAAVLAAEGTRDTAVGAVSLQRPCATEDRDQPAPTRQPAQFRPDQRVEPLAQARYRVQFTASAELRDQIRKAQELLSHAVPNRDLAIIFERALGLLIAEQERRRLGACVSSTQVRSGHEISAQPAVRSRHIPAAVRRLVWKRDGGQCTFVDAHGRRCAERRFLEFEHRTPYAEGGLPTVDNVCLLCRAHNRAAAERRYGRPYLEHRIRQEQRARGTRPEPSGRGR